MSVHVPVELQREVRDRADHRCEYCGVPADQAFIAFHLDHCISRKHGGPTISENLALACPACNVHKGTDVAGIDPGAARPVALFNPRTQAWDDHFESVGHRIIGRTATGRVTSRLLRMNDSDRLADRIEAAGA